MRNFFAELKPRPFFTTLKNIMGFRELGDRQCLCGTKNRHSFLISAVIATLAFMSGSSAMAFTSADDQNVYFPFGDCWVKQRVQSANGVAEVFLLDKDYYNRPAGNQIWVFGTITTFTTSITTAVIADCLGVAESNVQSLIQNGPDGTYETDDYIGFVFTLLTPAGGLTAGEHEYKIGKGSLLPTNTAPTANAGPDQTVAAAASVTLDGSGSSDPDAGQTLTYAWTQTSGTSVVLSDSTAQSPSFTAPTLAIGDADAILTFSLVVNDGVEPSLADTVTVTVTAPADTTAPTVTLSGAPTTSAAGDTFSVTVTFSETVTGFIANDISITNGTVIGLSGSDATYVATVRTTGAGNTQISVPAGAASDPAGNDNLVSNMLNISDLTSEQTQELIASYMQTRANLLVRNQPGLITFLSSTPHGSLNFAAMQGAGSFDFATGADYPIWAQATGSWANDSDSSSRYVLAALGSHQAIHENLLVGAMLQFDSLTEDTGVGSVSGAGWMIGPYFVAKSATQPLYFEGRLLYGETNNSISPFGTYEDSFDTTRMLAQVKIAGELTFGSTTLTPFLDASYTTDDQHSYLDNLGNLVPEQGIAIGQIEIGTDFSHMLPVDSGELELFGGVSGIWSHSSGSGFASTVTPDYEGGRARIELGINRTMSAGQRFTATTYYDGIGASRFESFGLRLGFEMPL